MTTEPNVEELDEAVKAALVGEEIEEEGEEVQESPEFSDTEQAAIAKGWNPDGVEGKKNLTAEEFLDRQQLYDDIRSLKKRNKRLEEQYEALNKHHKHVAEREREKLMLELKAAKAAALSQDDYEAVVELDEQIAKAREPATEETVTTEQQANEAFQSWITGNSWYNTDMEMREYADTVGIGYYNRNNKPDPEDVYKYVAEEVRKRFPDKFGNSNRGKPTPVEGAKAGRNAKTSKYSVRDLPDEARQIMKTLIRTGAITEEQYLKEYFG